MQIVERLLHIVGHFFKYDAILNKNIPVKESVFLSIDRVITEQGKNGYIIHVTDQKGTLSFCRSEIGSDRCIQLNADDQVLFWVGDVRADGSVPAWVFYIADPKDLGPLKGILVKTIQEVNFMKMQEQLG